MREGSNPNFCPPVEEGLTINFEDSKGDATVLEFLGLLLHGGHRYGVFFPVSEEEPALSSGEVIILEAVEFDEDDQPSPSSLWRTKAWRWRCMPRSRKRRRTSTSSSRSRPRCDNHGNG